MLLLLLLYARFQWRSETKAEVWDWLIWNSRSGISPVHLVSELDQKLSDPNYTLFDFLSWIYEDYIIQHTLHIYNQKVSSSLYARPVSWFYPDGDVYRIDRQYEPRFRNSRFTSCLNILRDLDYCQFVDPHYELTHDGVVLLKKLDIPVR